MDALPLMVSILKQTMNSDISAVTPPDSMVTVWCRGSQICRRHISAERDAEGSQHDTIVSEAECLPQILGLSTEEVTRLADCKA
jgi:hypothetical protein